MNEWRQKMTLETDVASSDPSEPYPKPVSEGRANAGNTHIAGEMFVAAELAKRGYSVSLTMGNAKAVDLFAEYKGQAICIQVKAIAKSKNVGWPLPFEKTKIIDDVI